MVVLPTETRRDWPLARAALHRLRRAVVGQILISSRVAHAVEAVAILEDLENLELRVFAVRSGHPTSCGAPARLTLVRQSEVSRPPNSASSDPASKVS